MKSLIIALALLSAYPLTSMAAERSVPAVRSGGSGALITHQFKTEEKKEVRSQTAKSNVKRVPIARTGSGSVIFHTFRNKA